jgi:hypothetical protein
LRHDRPRPSREPNKGVDGLGKAGHDAPSGAIILTWQRPALCRHSPAPRIRIFHGTKQRRGHCSRGCDMQPHGGVRHRRLVVPFVSPSDI